MIQPVFRANSSGFVCIWFLLLFFIQNKIYSAYRKRVDWEKVIIFRMLKGKAHRTKHFKNAPFLKALGQHCQKIRSQKGFSIDRLAKEGEQLSPSVIHRLETGVGAVTVSALFRYARALGILPKDLLDFEFPFEVSETPSLAPDLVDLDDPRIKKEAFKKLLPLYSIKAAAGYFGMSAPAEPLGWVRVGSDAEKLNDRMFVVRAEGNSMLPKIRGGDHLVFQANPSGTRQGRIVLAQYRGPADPETGGSFTVKQYFSSKIASPSGGWRHKQITLSPLNPEFEPIILLPKDMKDFRIIAEYLFTLGQ